MKVRKSYDTEDPVLANYRQFRNRHFLRESGICIAEGIQTVRRLLQSTFAIQSVLISSDCLELLEPDMRANLNDEIPVLLMPKPEMEKLTGVTLTQGVLALAAIPGYPDLQSFVVDRPFLLVVLEGVDHAANLGAIARNCAALGADGLIVGPGSAYPYSPRAVKASGGAVFRLPVFIPEDLSVSLARLKADRSAVLIAADPGATNTIEDIPASGPVCLILGNEHRGIRKEILEMSSFRCRIPMSSGIDSLNVASAAALFLYAIRRLRRDEGNP